MIRSVLYKGGTSWFLAGIVIIAMNSYSVLAQTDESKDPYTSIWVEHPLPVDTHLRTAVLTGLDWLGQVQGETDDSVVINFVKGRYDITLTFVCDGDRIDVYQKSYEIHPAKTQYTPEGRIQYIYYKKDGTEDIRDRPARKRRAQPDKIIKKFLNEYQELLAYEYVLMGKPS